MTLMLGPEIGPILAGGATLVAVFATGWQLSKSRNGYVKSLRCAEYRKEDREERGAWRRDIKTELSDIHGRVTEVATALSRIEGYIKGTHGT